MARTSNPLKTCLLLEERRMHEPRTKIIATLGDPNLSDLSDTGTYRQGLFDASRDRIREPSLQEVVDLLVVAGADVLRLNLAHVPTSGVAAKFKAVKTAVLSAEERFRIRKLGLLADLPGPKIRFKSNFILPRERLSVGFWSGQEDLASPEQSEPVERPNNSTVRLLLGHDPFGSAAPAATAAILEEVKSRLRSDSGRPLLAFVGDNEATLEVKEVTDDLVVCQVLASKYEDDALTRQGIGSKRGFTIRGISKEIPAFTDEDKEKLSILLTVDHEGGEPLLSHVGISFCQTREDVRRALFHVVETLKGVPAYEDKDLDEIFTYAPLLIAKIETDLGVNNTEEMLDLADGVMIARGDLALEMETVQLPEVSKNITSHANLRGKPVIIATQMLESMKTNIECSRPEAADVFNAVVDGADALLLSGETSSGRFPAIAIAKMRELALRAETFLSGEIAPDDLITSYFDRLMESTHRVKDWETRWETVASSYTKMKMSQKRELSQEEYHFIIDVCDIKAKRLRQQNSTDRISHAACTMAADEEVEALVSPTTSGRTARMLARFRPRVGVIALPHDTIVARKLQTSWGVRVLTVLGSPPDRNDLHWLMSISAEHLMKAGYEGAIVFTCGTPLSRIGTTNMVQRWARGEMEIIAQRTESSESENPDV